MGKNTTPTPDDSNPFIPSAGGDRDDGELENELDQAEERVTRSRAPDVRGDRGFNEDSERTGAAFDDIDEFERQLESEFEDDRLPSPPKLAGYHTCWLTSNNNYDSIGKRQRLGYIPVRQDEAPSFNVSNGQKIDSFEGVITCNEMVLHKIQEARYQALMNYYHHKRPLQDEGAQIQKIRDGNEQAEDRNGRSLGSTEGDGINTLERSVQRGRNMARPTFR